MLTRVSSEVSSPEVLCLPVFLPQSRGRAQCCCTLVHRHPIPLQRRLYVKQLMAFCKTAAKIVNQEFSKSRTSS